MPPVSKEIDLVKFQTKLKVLAMTLWQISKTYNCYEVHWLCVQQ